MKKLWLLFASVFLCPAYASGAPVVDQWALVPDQAAWVGHNTLAHRALAQTFLTNKFGVLDTIGLQVWHLDDQGGRGTIEVEVRQMKKGNNPSGDLVASGRIIDTGFLPTAGQLGSTPFPVPLTLVDVSSARYLTTIGERLSIVVKSQGAYGWKQVDATNGAKADFYARGNPYERNGLSWTQIVADHGFATFVETVNPGDVDLDGAVNFTDFNKIKQNFGKGAKRTDGDLTRDGIVGFDDFILVKSNFGDAAAADVALVPEPASYFGWAVAMLGLFAWRAASGRRRLAK